MFLFVDFLGASVIMFISVSTSGGTFIYASYYQNPITNISAYCKVWCYLQLSVGMMYRWMLTAACLDRYVASSSNAHLRRFANISIARRVVTVIVIIWIILPIPLLVLYGVRENNCIVIYGYIAGLYIGIFTIINACSIPLPIMITCTILIRRNLANKRQRRLFIIPQQDQTKDRGYLQRKRDQQALVMLFAQIIVYIILTIPWMSCLIYNAMSLNILNKSFDRLNIERLMIQLTGLIILLFPTASFYLYTLTSSIFRKELCNMLKSIIYYKCYVNNRRVEPMIGNVL